MKPIILFGDSISRGWALGTFDPLPSNPLYSFRAAWTIINLLLADAGLTERAYYGGSCTTQADVDSIVDRLARGVIPAGSTLICEDAGAHSQNPDAYEAWWLTLRAAVMAFDVRLVLPSMYEYAPAPLNSRYDTVFGTRTMNQATQAAATALISGEVGKTSFLDMNAIMDAELVIPAPYRPGQYGVPWFHADGIHPNVWGNMLLAGEYLKAAGLRPSVWACGQVRKLASDNYSTLAYGSQSLTGSIADAWAAYCCIRPL